MSKIDDGGPVFPFIHTGVKGDAMHTEQRSGMSLRDYMAIHASTDDIESVGMIAGESENFRQLTRSERRYIWADAMIAARKGGEA